MYKAGIIGCGFIGVKASDSHCIAYELCPDIEERIVSVDPVEDAMFSRTSDIDGLGLDIISVCTPPETHLEIVRELCHFETPPRAIWLEKPIATSMFDAEQIIGEVAKAQIQLVVNHQRNFMAPTFRFSRGILNTGTHMFALLEHLFGHFHLIGRNQVLTKSGLRINIEEVKGDEPVFEFDCTHNGEPMLGRVLELIVAHLDADAPCNLDYAREAMESLRHCINWGLMAYEQ